MLLGIRQVNLMQTNPVAPSVDAKKDAPRVLIHIGVEEWDMRHVVTEIIIVIECFPYGSSSFHQGLVSLTQDIHALMKQLAGSRFGHFHRKSLQSWRTSAWRKVCFLHERLGKYYSIIQYITLIWFATPSLLFKTNSSETLEIPPSNVMCGVNFGALCAEASWLISCCSLCRTEPARKLVSILHWYPDHYRNHEHQDAAPFGSAQRE